MNDNYTALAVIVDRSGSMGSIAYEAENSLNEFVDAQKKEPGEASLRYVTFDDYVETQFASTNLDKITQRLTISPRGMTALNDAMGKTIVEFGLELDAMSESERPGKVLVIVVTDGGENSSKEYTTQDVKKMVEHQQSVYNWEFVFIGANQDAVLTAQGYGIRRDNALTFDPNNIAVAAASMSNYTSNLRSGLTSSFTDEDRNNAVTN